MGTAEDAHRAMLEAFVAHLAPHCADFHDLLLRMPGAFPSDVLETLDRLAGLRLVDSDTHARLRPEAGERVDDAPGHDDLLPPPHPLDYDWRFDEVTVDRLVQRCVQYAGPGDTVLFLGTPTLYRRVMGDESGRRWMFLDAGAATVGAFGGPAAENAILCDLFHDDLPDVEARVIVADPPWYAAHTRVFLWAAARLTRPGAAVLVAQPGVATRPGALHERAALLAWAHDAGLESSAIATGEIGYVSPPFERLALETAGLDRVRPTWRRGDLVEFRRVEGRHVERPALDDVKRWREVIVRGARLRFRTDRPERRLAPVDPRMVSITEGNVLRSVSLRDPLRAQVAVWSGTNRVFTSHAPLLLAAIAEAMSDGLPARAAAQAHLGRKVDEQEAEMVECAAGQLRDLIRLETAACGPVTVSPDHGCARS